MKQLFSRDWYKLVVLFGIAATGCDSSQNSVSGRVTINGKPLPVGTVIFHTQTGETHLCWVRDDGAYRIDHLPLGKAKVSIAGLNRKPEGFRLAQQLPPVKGGPTLAPPPDSQFGVDFVPPHYGDPELSGITCDIVCRETICDIELIGKPARKK